MEQGPDGGRPWEVFKRSRVLPTCIWENPATMAEAS